MNNNNKQISQKDVKLIWHPCSQMKDHEIFPIIPIKKGQGVYLIDFDGNVYIDAISSWWVNIFGHNNPYISKAIKYQLNNLEHIMFAGFTHKPAVVLAEKLIDISPLELNKVFFADNGSSAVEVALKMSFHFHKNKGENRDTFLSLTNSYHGETIGALSVGDVKLYKETYKPLLLKSIQTPVPINKSIDAALNAIKKLELILSEKGDSISAFIIEPLVQGAGGMHMYHSSYISKAKILCEKYGIHLIIDEILTGFGRTGTMFAIEKSGISPDFMLLSKGLTGGYLPLAIVLTTNNIYNNFYADYNENKSFLHSHSYTGNPLACSAAIATLDIFKKNNILEENIKKAEYFQEKVEKIKLLDNVKEIRQTGMIIAIELENFKTEERIGVQIHRYALENGVIIRPLGNIIYFMPPYIIKNYEIDIIIDTTYKSIEYINNKYSNKPI